MRKFKYENDGNQVHMEVAEMDMTQLAAEIGHIIRQLHSSLHQQEPAAAL